MKKIREIRYSSGRVLGLPTWRFGLFVLTALLSILAYFLIPQSEIDGIIRYGAYWWALSLLGFVLIYAFIEQRESRGIVRPSRRTALLFIICAAVLYLHANFDFNVVMDEYILSASAKRLHATQEYLVATHGYWEDGAFTLTSGYLDKRPWLYPFCLSLVHTLTGFRVENAFLLNGVLGLVLILLVMRIGFRIGGGFTMWLGMLMLVGIPLLAQNATGGGMDLLNLTCLAWFIYQGMRYIENPSSSREGLFVLALICLVYARYESLMYLPAGALILLIGWWRQGYAHFSWPTIVSLPLLLGAFLQNRFFRSSNFLWELPDTATRPFSLEHLGPNFGHAVYFLFNFDGALANSVLVSLLGLLAVVLLIVRFRMVIPRIWRNEPLLLVLALAALGVLLNFLILLCYHDGQLDRIYVSRLALPFYLLLVLLTVTAVHLFFPSPRFRLCLIVLSGIYVLAWTLPHNSRELFSKRNYVQNELHWLTESMVPQSGQRDLVVDHKSTVWTLHDVTALRPYLFFENLEWVEARMVSGFYRHVYFIDRLEFVFEDGEFRLQEPNYPTATIEGELIAERSFRPFSLLRIYRVAKVLPDRIPADFLNKKDSSGHVADYTFNGL